MGFQHYLARQLSNPIGIIGKFILVPLWNRRNARLNEVTFEHLELKEDDRVLDIGFGGGYLLDRIIPKLKRGWVAGIDVSPVMVKNCRQRYREELKAGRVDVRCGRAETLPYPDGYFTKVSTVNSIFYWSDAREGIAEIYRVLQEKGRVVLHIPTRKIWRTRGLCDTGSGLTRRKRYTKF